MKIETDLTKSDLLRFNLAYLPHNKFFVVGSPFCALTLMTAAVLSTDLLIAGSWLHWIFFLLLSLVVGYGAMLAVTAFSLVCILLSSTKKNGVLGHRTIEIDENGIHVVTPISNGSLKWEAVLETKPLRQFMTIKTNRSMFYLIPRRSFASDQTFQGFASRAKELWLGSQK